MNATQTRLNKMTVKALREIVREIGIKGLSGSRKAELVMALTVWIEGCHADALIADSMYLPTHKMDAALTALANAKQAEIEHFEAAQFYQDARDKAIAHRDAIEQDSIIDEAYGWITRERGITIPAYLACRKAHARDGEIKVSGFWTCCEDNPVKAAVMDLNGQQAPQGVCAKDVRMFPGEVIEIDAEMVRSECTTCGETYLVNRRLTDSKEIEQAFTEFDAMVISDSAKTAEDAIDTVVSLARESIKALTPIMQRAETVFYAARDAQTPDEVRIDVAYQVFADTRKAIEEFQRTIAFITGTDAHTCHYEREIAMSACQYGCKIYGCAKCDDTRVIHNATYGCRKGL